MRSRTSNWFEVGIRYQKTQEDGSVKSVTEKYAIDALSFTEGESTIIEEMAAYISSDFKVKSMKEASYKEIFLSDKDEDDCWYKAKLQFISFDDKTNKEKRSNVTYLVQAKSLARALRYIDEVMGKTMIDYEIIGLSKTNVYDVFEHKTKEENGQKSNEEKKEE